MVKIIAAATIIVFISVLSFWVGAWWEKSHIAKWSKSELTSSIEVQLSPNNVGSLPAGTVLYEYRELPEITTYVVFVNLKERNILGEVIEENRENVVSPLSGYLK